MPGDQIVRDCTILVRPRTTAFRPAGRHQRWNIETGQWKAVTVGDRTTWLACEPFGWRPIDTPAVVSRQPPTGEAVYQRLRRGRDA